MSSKPELVRLTNARHIAAYLAESAALFRPVSETERDLYEVGLRIWLDNLVRRGLTGLPPFVVAELTALARGCQFPVPAAPSELPDPIRSLRERYHRALSALVALERFRFVFQSSRFHRSFPNVLREFLVIVAGEVGSRIAQLPAFDCGILPNCIIRGADLETRPTRWDYAPLWESAAAAIEGAAAEWGKAESGASTRQTDGLLDASFDPQVVGLLLPAMAPDSPAAWDTVAIERTLDALKAPVLTIPEQQRLFARLPNLRVEKVRVRSHLPEGGFVGLRANGGLEEIGSVAPSELAFPRRAFLEKAFNRRLNVFERPLQRVRARRLDFCFFVFDLGQTLEHLHKCAAFSRAETASVLARTLSEVWITLGRCQHGDLTAHLFLPSEVSSFGLARLGETGDVSGLPFFLDRTRSGGLVSLYLVPLGESRLGGGRGTSPPGDYRPKLQRVLDQADATHILCFGGPASSTDAEALAAFAKPQMQLGQSGTDSLFDARLCESGWSLSVHGARGGAHLSGLASSVVVRELVTRLLQRMLHINVAHFGRQESPVSV